MNWHRLVQFSDDLLCEEKMVRKDGKVRDEKVRGRRKQIGRWEVGSINTRLISRVRTLFT